MKSNIFGVCGILNDQVNKQCNETGSVIKAVVGLFLTSFIDYVVLSGKLYVSL